jgi:hypothetical protein
MRDFIDDVASTSSCLSVEETVGDVAAPTFEIIKEMFEEAEEVLKNAGKWLA